MLRSVSDKMPSCCDSTSVSAWPGRQFERRGLADHILSGPFFSSMAWSIASTRILLRMVSLVRDSVLDLLSPLSRRVRMTSTRSFRQNEAAGAGFRRDLRGNGAHAGRQDRRHEARALGVHQLGFADRLARDEGHARDLSCKSLDGLRIVVAADEISGRCAGRPGLPLQVGRRQSLTQRDVAMRDQDVNSVDLDGFLFDLRRLFAPARSMAATPPAAMATVSTTTRAAFIRSLSRHGGRSGRLNHMAAHSAARTGFHQLKVKVWLSSGI